MMNLATREVLTHPIYDKNDHISNRKLVWVLRFLNSYGSGNNDLGLVLDAGCGRGEYLPLFTERSTKLIGVDIDISCLKRAKANTNCQQVDSVRGNLARLPFKNEAFDTVVCLSVLEHLNNPAKAANQISLVAKKGSIIIFNVPWLWDILDHPAMAICYRLLDSIQQKPPNLFARAIFMEFHDPSKIRLRRWFSFIWNLYRKFSKLDVDLQQYAREHLTDSLQHTGHKHWFTPNEWMRLVQNNGFTVLNCTGSYIAPPGAGKIPGTLPLFYWIEDHLPHRLTKWLGASFIIAATKSEITSASK